MATKRKNVYNLRPRKQQTAAVQSKFAKHPRIDNLFKNFRSLDSARTFAQREKKWLMINLEQSVLKGGILDRILHLGDNFSELKNLLSKHFIIWELDQKSRAGIRVKNSYGPVKGFPYVAILDPANGQKLAECDSFSPSVLKANVDMFLLSRVKCVNKSADLSLQIENIPNSSSESNSDVPAKVFTKDQTITKNEITAEKATVESSNIKQDGGHYSDTTETMNGASKMEEKITFIIRFPDGERRVASWPITATLQSLYMFAEENGFNAAEILALHPFRRLVQSDLSKTFEEANLFDNEVLFLQRSQPEL